VPKAVSKDGAFLEALIQTRQIDIQDDHFGPEAGQLVQGGFGVGTTSHHVARRLSVNRPRQLAARRVVVIYDRDAHQFLPDARFIKFDQVPRYRLEDRAHIWFAL
jgi:hypothetical protein